MTTENKEQGFIKIYRSMFSWDWWGDINTFRLFVTMLMMANWEPKKWRGRRIPRGSFFTSLSTLSKRSGLTIKQVRTSLNKLIETNEVASEGASNGRLITITNYDFYQSSDETRASDKANEKADKGQTKGKRRATTKEVKEVKELKNVVVVVPKTKKEFWKRLSSDDIDTIYESYPESGGILIDEVAEEVVSKKRKVRNPVPYILEYAKRIEWDDKADHIEELML